MRLPYDWEVPALLLGMLALLAGLCYWAYADAKAWERYAAEHHCATTGSTREYVIMQPIYGSDGKGNTYVISYVPQQIVERQYRCDGGELRWR